MAKIRSVSMLEKAAKKFAEAAAGCRLAHQPVNLAGNPDYANKAKKVAVFIHGCFWHQPCPNRCCKIPRNNAAFWKAKFERNAARHCEVERELKAAGFKIVVVWECSIVGMRRAARLRLIPQHDAAKLPTCARSRRRTRTGRGGSAGGTSTRTTRAR
jgi:DNA mismatch endonuclease (patch repair protein)